MGIWLRPTVALAIVVLGGALATGQAGAEEANLELKRLELPGHAGVITTNLVDREEQLEYLFRATRPQHYYTRFGKEGPKGREAEEKQFAALVKKEPAKYGSKYPFRAIATLGGKKYGFVLDASDAKIKGYDRLYFDVNGNGDLTDDEPIDAVKEGGGRFGGSMTYAQFPRVDMKLADGDKKYDYSFFFTAYAQISEKRGYVSASLNAAAYRIGEITIDGKARQVALVDYNSNGRFDDSYRIRENVRGADGRIYPEQGDVMFFDPKKAAEEQISPYSATGSGARNIVAKLINLEGQFYDMKISPSGEKLAISPSSVPLGNLTNSGGDFRAVIYGKHGFLTLAGKKGQPVAVPVGQWQLLTYTIEQPKEAPSEKKEDEKKEEVKKEEKKETEKKRSLLEAVASAFFGSSSDTEEKVVTTRRRPRRTQVSAYATADYKPVTVAEGKTVTMPFGPPYKPVVSVAMRGSDEKKVAYLGLSLVGSAGERCTGLEVEGGRPPKPEFVILTLDGEEVASGNFEYG